MTGCAGRLPLRLRFAAFTPNGLTWYCTARFEKREEAEAYVAVKGGYVQELIDLSAVSP